GYQTIRAAIDLLVERFLQRDLLFIALGDDASAERIGRADVRFVPYEDDPEAVARYYQAADLYLHAARADTFPNTILEALACGTPVVATALGGIPEQIDDGRTGLLVPPADPAALAAAATRLLADPLLRATMSDLAARTARARFGL